MLKNCLLGYWPYPIYCTR